MIRRLTLPARFVAAGVGAFASLAVGGWLVFVAAPASVGPLPRVYGQVSGVSISGVLFWAAASTIVGGLLVGMLAVAAKDASALVLILSCYGVIAPGWLLPWIAMDIALGRVRDDLTALPMMPWLYAYWASGVATLLMGLALATVRVVSRRPGNLSHSSSEDSQDGFE